MRNRSEEVKCSKNVIDAIGNQLLHENNDDKDIKRNMIGMQNSMH